MKISPDTFEMISGLPGEELIAPGLRDLEQGNHATVEVLLIFIARTRLSKAGFLFLDNAELNSPANPESQLYQLLMETDQQSAYSLYNSLKRRLNSFMSSLETRRACVMR